MLRPMSERTRVNGLRKDHSTAGPPRSTGTGSIIPSATRSSPSCG